MCLALAVKAKIYIDTFFFIGSHGRMVRMLDSSPEGSGFESLPSHDDVFLGQTFHPAFASPHPCIKGVPGLGRPHLRASPIWDVGCCWLIHSDDSHQGWSGSPKPGG